MNHDLEIKEYFPVKASSFIDNPLSDGEPLEVTLVSVTNPLPNGAPISPYSDYWVSILKGRSIGASQWVFSTTDIGTYPFDYDKFEDIELIFDTVGISVAR